MTKPTRQYRYLFGPVPSRRLGLSLGVDIIPFKTCTQNCLYCQLGRDGNLTLERKSYVPPEAVLKEIEQWLHEGGKADYITISGSGEPTLHRQLEKILDGIHALTSIPIAVITNGTLLHLPDVRKACCKADVVLPSLDAGDETTFQEINKPHPNLKFVDFVDGLLSFRKEYIGPIWLEVFLCDNLNTGTESIQNLRQLIAKICPDRVQLNTAVRPTAHPGIKAVNPEKLKAIAEQLRPDAEIIADFPVDSAALGGTGSETQILDTLKRRPCGLEELCKSLSISPNFALKYLQHLQEQGKIRIENQQGKLFYCVK